MSAEDRKVVGEVLRDWTLFDDTFMRVVFKAEPVLVQELLRRVIGKPDLVVRKVQVQDDRKQLIARSAVFDVLAVDGEGRHYNIEIQKDDSGASPRRARFHSAVLDAQLLRRKQEPSTMAESFVVMIAANDVIGRGRAVYVFDRADTETGEALGDGSHIVYVNGAWQGDDPVGQLVHDMKCASAAKMKIGAFAKAVRRFKRQERRGDGMCALAEKLVKHGEAKGFAKGEAKGRAEGEAKGEAKSSRNAAEKLLTIGKLTLAEIAMCTGLALREIRKIKAGMERAAAL